MDPGTERRLRALDAALAGEPVDAELADLRELALAVQAERPVPPQDFVSALDARAAAGFPKQQTGTATARSRPKAPRRLLPLALGSGAAAFIVGIALLSGDPFSGGGSALRSRREAPASAPIARPAAPESAKEAAGSAEGGGTRALAPPSPTPRPPGFAPRAPVRKVERAASITLATPRDQVEDVADRVIRTADRYGGFVLDSSVSSGEREAGATIDLRIPSSRLAPAIADLSKLAHVKARSQQALDITARFSSPRRELADATAERRALLAQLARAATPNETASIRARLRLANDRITAARASLRRLENRVNYSAVSVTVEAGAEAGGGSWSAGDAFWDALAMLGVSAGVLLIALAVLVPLTLLFAVGWAGRRVYLQRVRNAALSPVEKPIRR